MRLVLTLMATLAAAPALAQNNGPIALRDMGSFHIGGRHAEQPARCFSTSARSLSFRRPSTYARIRVSIRPQLMTTFLLGPYCLPAFATSGASSTRSVSYVRKSKDFNALSEHCKIFEISP